MGHTEYLADGGIFDPNAEGQAAIVEEIGRKLADVANAMAAQTPPPAVPVPAPIVATVYSNAADVAVCAVCPPCAAPGPFDFYYALLRNVNWADKLMNVIALLFILTMAYWLFVAVRALLRFCQRPQPEDSPRTASSRASQFMQAQLAARR